MFVHYTAMTESSQANQPTIASLEETSTLTTSKKMQYAKLHSELARLNENIQDFGDRIKVTAEQQPSFRQMGTLHASLFMSVNKTLQPKNAFSSSNTRI